MADQEVMTIEELTDTGKLCIAKVQELYAQFDLDSVDGMLVAGEIMGWATIVSMPMNSRAEVMEQLERNLASVRDWVATNYDAFKTRQAMLERLDAGDSGGRLQ